MGMKLSSDKMTKRIQRKRIHRTVAAEEVVGDGEKEDDKKNKCTNPGRHSAFRALPANAYPPSKHHLRQQYYMQAALPFPDFCLSYKAPSQVEERKNSKSPMTLLKRNNLFVPPVFSLSWICIS